MGIPFPDPCSRPVQGEVPLLILFPLELAFLQPVVRRPLADIAQRLRHGPEVPIIQYRLHELLDLTRHALVVLQRHDQD